MKSAFFWRIRQSALIFLWQVHRTGKKARAFVMYLLIVCSSSYVSAQSSCDDFIENINAGHSTGIAVGNASPGGFGHETYVCTVPNASNFSWSASMVPAANASNILSWSGNLCQVNIDVDDPYSDSNVQSCTILLKVEYDTDAGTRECSEINLVVEPYIQDNHTCISPGDPPSHIYLMGPCENGPTGHPYTYNWTTAPANFCTTCGPNVPAYEISVPTDHPELLPSAFTVYCTISNTYLNISQALEPVTIPLCFDTPVISGPACVGCLNCTATSDEVDFTCNLIPGAGYYNWFVPSGGLIVQGQGTRHIKVKMLSTGTIAIGVLAQTTETNPTIISPPSIHPHIVQICCISHIDAVNDVNTSTTDVKQAGNSITADNTIYAGATAEYHAGYDVELSPGFSAWPDCYFHAYTEYCSTYWYRPDDSSGADSISIVPVTPSTDLNNTTITTPGVSPDFSIKPTTPVEEKVSVFPNPNNGAFTLSSTNRLTGKIVITNDLGIQVYEKEIKNLSKMDLNLFQLETGVYILSIYAKGKTVKPLKLIIE